MKNVFIILTVFVLLAACTKEQLSDNIFFDKDVRQKYFYKKGSYWIYRDSISGRVDSFYVSEVYTHVPEAKATWYQDDEEMGITITQKISDTSIKDIIKWEIGYIAKTYVRSSYSRNSASNSIFFNINNSRVLYNPRSNYKIPELGQVFSNFLIGDFKLGTKNFQNVCEIHCENIDNNKNDCTFYFNDSVGYIKMRFNFDNDTFKIKEVWELQRWHVIK